MSMIVLQTTQQIIEDRKPFIDDLNATGLELMELCGDNDAGEIQTKLVNVNERFEKLKHEARGKLREMADTRQNMTQEVGVKGFSQKFQDWRLHNVSQKGM